MRFNPLLSEKERRLIEVSKWIRTIHILEVQVAKDLRLKWNCTPGFLRQAECEIVEALNLKAHPSGWCWEGTCGTRYETPEDLLSLGFQLRSL
jgi:hypothetical protein